MRTDIDQMTLEEIRVVGLQAIANELGPVGLVRFLQIFETGKGDYSTERHEWVDRLSGEDIDRGIRQMKRL